MFRSSILTASPKTAGARQIVTGLNVAKNTGGKVFVTSMCVGSGMVSSLCTLVCSIRWTRLTMDDVGNGVYHRQRAMSDLIFERAFGFLESLLFYLILA